MGEAITPPEAGERSEYDFAVTEKDVVAFIDQVIGRCYMTEQSQYAEIYDAIDARKHEGFMDVSLYCQCSPEARVILASTADVLVWDHPVVRHDGWTLWVFDHPTDLPGRVLYRVLRTHVEEGAPFHASAFDDGREDSWIAHLYPSQ